MEPGGHAQTADADPGHAVEFHAENVIDRYRQTDDHAGQRPGPRRPAPEYAKHQRRKEGGSN